MEITIKFKLKRKLYDIVQLNPYKVSVKVLYQRLREAFKKGGNEEYLPLNVGGEDTNRPN